jgi:hypothetical protein
MGYLLIDKLDITKITIDENPYGYKLLYKLPYLTLFGLYIRLHDIHISQTYTHYTITINDPNSLSILSAVDTRFTEIQGYVPILKQNKLIFKKHAITDSLVKKYIHSTFLDINIQKIIRNASYLHPLVYII